MYNIQPKTLIVGKTIKYLPSCHSTNVWCANYVENESVSEGFAVYTPHQFEGKGQRGNKWESEIGKNITMSIFLKPNFLKASDQFQLNMAISLGIYEAISKYLNEDLKIKWPNDLYFDNSKLGGILIENTIFGSNLNTSIIGIGLNINQIQFEISHATSIKKILGATIDLEIGEIMSLIFEGIEKYYLKLKSGEIDAVRLEFLEKLFRINQWHYYRKNDQEFSGKIIGVDNIGRLKMETETSEELFDFKEVEFII
ncbi:MAG: biotin--[acetyl-CoA-carboxylase] ligase [Bacteroidota bacterium]